MSKPGRKNTGRIFTRNNKYYFRYRINDKEKTVSLQIDVSEPDAKARAQEKAQEYLPVINSSTREEIAAHVAIARRLKKEQNKLKLQNLLQAFQDNPTRPNCTERTLLAHKCHIKKFTDYIGQYYPHIQCVDEIDHNTVAGYVKTLAEMSARNFNGYIGTLKLAFRLIQNEMPDNINPFQNIQKRTLETISKQDFSEKQLKTIFKVFESDTGIMHQAEMEILFYLGAYTGLRLKDNALAEWKDFDFETETISCKPMKTKKNNRYVIIPMHPVLKEKLLKAAEWKTNDNPYVLPAVAARYLYNDSGVKKDTGKVLEMAGIIEKIKKNDDTQTIEKKKAKRKIYGFHSLRHSFVSFCARAGVPLAVVQTIVGHGNPAVTRLYTHIGTNSFKQVIDALPGAKPSQKETAQQKQLAELIDILKDNPNMVKSILKDIKA